jgi:valyl-tRNA synthetase
VAVIPGEAVEIVEEHRAESGEEVVVLDSDIGTILVYE